MEDLTKEFIEMLKEKGKTEVKVSSLPTSLRSLILELGYDESATISVPKLEEYLNKAWGHISPNPKSPRVPKTVGDN